MSSGSTTRTTEIDDETPKLITRIEPPAPTTRKLENPFLFVLQVIYFILILIPVTIYSIVEDIFFTKPKCLKEKVVIVSGELWL